MSVSVKREDLTAYVDGELTPEEERVLEGRIADDPRLMKEISLLLRQRLMLAVILSAEETAAAPVRRTGRLRRALTVFVPLAAAAAVVLGIGMNVWWDGMFAPPAPSPDGAVIAVVTEASRALLSRAGDGVRYALVEGVELGAGDAVETGPGGALRVAYAGEKSQVCMSERTKMRLTASPEGAKRLHVASGVMKAAIASQPRDGRMVITTPHAAMTLLGTEFALNVTEDETHMDVMKGTVGVGKPGGEISKKVVAGQFMTVTARRLGTPLWRAGAVVGQVQVLRCVSSPVPHPDSIVFDGSGLWVSSLDDRKLRRIDPRSGAVLRAIDPGKSIGRVSALAWDGKLLWGAHKIQEKEKNGICAIDPASGDVVETFESSRGIRHLAFGDGKLWAGFDRGQYVHVATVRPPQDPEHPLVKVGYPATFSFVFQDGFLWMKRDGKYLVRVDPDSGKMLGGFQIQPFASRSIAAGGNGTFWISDRSSNSRITLIEPPKTLLRIQE